MKTLTYLLILLLSSSTFSLADEKIRRVQEELRKRNIYFGEIDGKIGDEVRGAIRRYQQRKGFVPTGEPCVDVLRSLNLAAPSPAAPEWPDELVLKSDAARAISENDRKFLEELMAEPVAEAPDDELEPPLAPEGDAAESADSAADHPPAPEAVQREQYEKFIRSYLADAETNNLDAEMSYYADRMQYFDHGVVDGKFVRRDVRNYYKRWPKRDYELLKFAATPVSPDEAVIRFRIAFQVERPNAKPVKGKTDNTFRVKGRGANMKLTALKEKRVRE